MLTDIITQDWRFQAVLASLFIVVLSSLISVWFKHEKLRLDLEFPPEINLGFKFDSVSQASVRNEIECVDPATGQILGYRPVASTDEVLGLIQRARIAQNDYKE